MSFNHEGNARDERRPNDLISQMNHGKLFALAIVFARRSHKAVHDMKDSWRAGCKMSFMSLMEMADHTKQKPFNESSKMMENSAEISQVETVRLTSG